MTIKITKVAEVVGRLVVVLSGQRRAKDCALILTNMTPVLDPIPGSSWQMELLIGAAPAERRVMIDLPPLLDKADPTDSPVFWHCSQGCLVYFHDRIFIPERPPVSVSEREEVALRAKKIVYDEELELSSLRAAVANLEAAIEFQKSGPKRETIPEDVKLVVWARDGGSCVRCGARQELHFDHIIPVAKGGGNSERNVQILCQSCNLKKSDRIAMI